MAVYLYGLVRAPVAIAVPKTPGVDGARVRLLEHGSLAGIVSDLPDAEFRAQRGDLLAHSDVLQEVVETADVLPMRFGTVFLSPDELLTDFVDPNQDDLSRMLDRLGGAIEVQVKGEYEPDLVAEEIFSRDRTIQKLQARARDRGDVDSKIEVGRRFATLLDQSRYADGRAIIDALAPLANDTAVGSAAGEYGVVNASFLVQRDALNRFEDALEESSASLTPRVKLRHIGPLPPYSFVDAETLVVR